MLTSFGWQPVSTSETVLPRQNYALAFLFAAQRIFISEDSLFLAAALIAGRTFVLAGPTSSEQTCPFFLPSAPSSLPRSACEPLHSCGGQNGCRLRLS